MLSASNRKPTKWAVGVTLLVVLVTVCLFISGRESSGSDANLQSKLDLVSNTNSDSLRLCDERYFFHGINGQAAQFHVPPYVKGFTIEAWGGGGAGGGGWTPATANQNAGGGGGAGGFVSKIIDTETLNFSDPSSPPIITIIAGRGGAGAAGKGSDGEDSVARIGNVLELRAKGGLAGDAYGAAVGNGGQGGAFDIILKGHSVTQGVSGQSGARGMTYAEYISEFKAAPYLGPVGRGGSSYKGGLGGDGGWKSQGQRGMSPGGGGGGGTSAVGASGARGLVIISLHFYENRNH